MLNSSRKEIPSSGELALTNKERLASVGLLRPITPALRRSNESKNFSVRRKAEFKVIEAEEKESAKGERL